MPIETFAFPNYYAFVVGSCRRLGVFACSQFKIFVVKVGSTCKNRTDLDEKRIFYCELSKKLSEAFRNISVLKIPLYDTNS